VGDDAEGGEVVEFPDMHFEGPNLDVPAPPPDLPYECYDDHNALALLDANAIRAAPGDVLAALDGQTGILLAAAAHAAGSLGLAGAVPRLQELAGGPDDQAAVEAAYALARLGRDDATGVLHEALARPVDAYLSPLLAAHFLARLGDPAGLPVVRAGLAGEFVASRMLACKALLSFVPFDAMPGRTGEPVDVAALFEQALRDGDQGVQGEALVQLRWAPRALATPLLERFLATSDDELLRGYAREALESPGPR